MCVYGNGVSCIFCFAPQYSCRSVCDRHLYCFTQDSWQHAEPRTLSGGCASSAVSLLHRTHVCVCVRVCVCVCVCVCISYTRVCMHIIHTRTQKHTNTHTHTHSLSLISSLALTCRPRLTSQRQCAEQHGGVPQHHGHSVGPHSLSPLVPSVLK